VLENAAADHDRIKQLEQIRLKITQTEQFYISISSMRVVQKLSKNIDQ
jgi:hypothetical protein